MSANVAPAIKPFRALRWLSLPLVVPPLQLQPLLPQLGHLRYLEFGVWPVPAVAHALAGGLPHLRWLRSLAWPGSSSFWQSVAAFSTVGCLALGRGKSANPNLADVVPMPNLRHLHLPDQAALGNLPLPLGDRLPALVELTTDLSVAALAPFRASLPGRRCRRLLPGSFGHCHCDL